MHDTVAHSHHGPRVGPIRAEVGVYDVRTNIQDLIAQHENGVLDRRSHRVGTRGKAIEGKKTSRIDVGGRHADGDGCAVGGQVAPYVPANGVGRSRLECTNVASCSIWTRDPALIHRRTCGWGG